MARCARVRRGGQAIWVVEGSDSLHDEGETGEGAAVAGGENLPVLQVGDGLHSTTARSVLTELPQPDYRR